MTASACPKFKFEEDGSCVPFKSERFRQALRLPRLAQTMVQRIRKEQELVIMDKNWRKLCLRLQHLIGEFVVKTFYHQYGWELKLWGVNSNPCSVNYLWESVFGVSQVPL